MSATDAVTLVFLLMVGHALCDFPLQGDFLANGKNRNTALGKQFWIYCLPAHGLIHGGAVYFVTGSIWLGLAETAAHMAIDYGKCDSRFGMATDQAAHITCKLLWAALVVFGVA